MSHAYSIFVDESEFNFLKLPERNFSVPITPGLKALSAKKLNVTSSKYFSYCSYR